MLLEVGLKQQKVFGWQNVCAGIEPCTLANGFGGYGWEENEERMMQHLRSRVSSLFAISVSDLALINMWCHDICREQAANKPASPKGCVPR